MSGTRRASLSSPTKRLADWFSVQSNDTHTIALTKNNTDWVYRNVAKGASSRCELLAIRHRCGDVISSVHTGREIGAPSPPASAPGHTYSSHLRTPQYCRG